MASVTTKLLFWLRLLAECAWGCLCAVPAMMLHLVVPRRQKNINGKVALVTGTAQNLGREIALELSRHGCTVICVDINAEGNKKTAQDVVKLGGNSREYTCDVADSKAVAELAIKAGPVDILVNNAGVVCLESLLESSEATITEVINVNVTSQFLMIRAFLPGMLERDSGHIVGITSCATLVVGLPNATLYNTAKQGVVGLMTTLAEVLRLQGRNKIKTSCVCPFFVRNIEAVSTQIDSRLPHTETVDAARDIVQGIRQELALFSIPRHMAMFLCIMSLFPKILRDQIKDVFQTQVKQSYTTSFPATIKT